MRVLAIMNIMNGMGFGSRDYKVRPFPITFIMFIMAKPAVWMALR
jgi:hypothetical protein